jgi:hypothetical protein
MLINLVALVRLVTLTPSSNLGPSSNFAKIYFLANLESISKSPNSKNYLGYRYFGSLGGDRN